MAAKNVWIFLQCVHFAVQLGKLPLIPVLVRNVHVPFIAICHCGAHTFFNHFISMEKETSRDLSHFYACNFRATI